MENEKNETSLKQTVSDVLSFELARPVITRLRDRLKEIASESSARHMSKTFGNTRLWKTEPPKMFISNLDAKYENGVGIITYSVFRKDGENKMVKIVTAKKPRGDGTMMEVEVAKEYILDKMMVETIEHYKPIVAKSIKM